MINKINMSYTQHVLDMLIQCKNDVKGDKIRERAYDKAFNALKGIDIKSIDDVQNIKGVGAGIKRKIELVLDSKEPTTKKSYDFTCIYGIGKKKLDELRENNITTIQELINNQHLLNDKQKIGLKYAHELVQRIPYEEMLQHDMKVKDSIPKKFRADIVGSYRRMKECSGDIDVLVCGDASTEPKLLENIVKSMGDYIIEILALKTKKFMGICRLSNGIARRIDIMITSPEEYVYALAYFTGSADHNVMMRAKARELGYTLNEHRMLKIDSKKPDVPLFKREKDLFDFLELEYKEPWDR